MATLIRASPVCGMNVQPDREVLVGLVERVTYHNAENGFCVVRVKARGHRDLVTLVGHAATISAGEWITPAQKRILGDGVRPPEGVCSMQVRSTCRSLSVFEVS